MYDPKVKFLDVADGLHPRVADEVNLHDLSNFIPPSFVYFISFFNYYLITFIILLLIIQNMIVFAFICTDHEVFMALHLHESYFEIFDHVFAISPSRK